PGGRPPRSEPPAAGWAGSPPPFGPRYSALLAASRCTSYPPRRLDELQLRQHAKLFGELGAADDRVEKRRMGGIHDVLHDLQPVAGIEIFLAGRETIAWPQEAVVHRKRRLEFGRTHVREDDAAVLVGRIGPVIEPVF